MRSPFLQALTAVGAGNWIKVDYEQRPFNEGMFYSVDEAGAGITAQVEHTPDNPDVFVNCTAVIVTTTATLTFANPHGLITGDEITLNNTALPNSPGAAPTFSYDGQYAVASTPTPSTLTVTVSGSGPGVFAPTARAALCRIFADANLVTLTTTRKYAANTVPVLATRLHVTAITGGTAYLEIVQGHSRG
jgi:hypothetical protein